MFLYNDSRGQCDALRARANSCCDNLKYPQTAKQKQAVFEFESVVLFSKSIEIAHSPTTLRIIGMSFPLIFSAIIRSDLTAV